MSKIMTLLFVPEEWKSVYPGAKIGVLALRNVKNPGEHPELDAIKLDLESRLRHQYADYDRQSLRALPTLQVYHDYYKRFKKSYHVQLQVESIVFKNRSIPNGAALVEAMFMAELKNFLLTAGHDTAVAQLPATIKIAAPGDKFTRINGQEQTLKPGDMVIADQNGVISSVIYGPDRRTQINPATTDVMFTVYAPSGIGETAVMQHMDDIENYVRVVSPDAILVEKRIYS